MWIKTPGKIKNGIYLIGSPSNPMYLVDCDNEWVLIEGGIIGNKSIILEQIKSYMPDLSLLKHWIITHSHYDHSGAIESLYQYFDNISLYASKDAINNFQNGKYVKKIRELNHHINPLKEEFQYDSKFDRDLLKIPFIAVEDGDIINIGNSAWSIIHTPGHSSCSISIYNKERQALFVSDALGLIANEKHWFPLAYQSVSQFLSSIKKLSKINVEVIALGHHGILTDDDAKYAAKNSLISSNEIIKWISSMTTGENDEEKTILEIRNKYFKLSDTFFPEDIFNKSTKLLIGNLRNENFI